MNGAPKMLAKPRSYGSCIYKVIFQTLRKYKCNHREKRKEDFLWVTSFTHTHNMKEELGEWSMNKAFAAQKWKAQSGCPIPVWNSGVDHVWPHHWGKGYWDTLPQNMVKNNKARCPWLISTNPSMGEGNLQTQVHTCTYTMYAQRQTYTHINTHTTLRKASYFKWYYSSYIKNKE